CARDQGLATVALQNRFDVW
nr:immunoglobulin heavy chain junction region [Macaca mulatta]MOW19198.1 immunoglobulin heavy chain junction region [Macaca mulatta]MOW19455.1 immunoglobulin heavy chain junction region [Macaca mulatta]MOW20061.1 immunoglobulin heavy chain junction region [Macaca mulatta]MOW20274.1 immunoglobulin heavy chain junction region [Macaca mulatta]